MNDKAKELLATQSYKGVPVITVAQLTEILSVGSSTVRSTLCVHKDKFKEGIHYYKLGRQELFSVIQEGVIPVNSAATNFTLLTEEGVNLYFYVKATSHQGKALPGKQQKVQQSLVTTKTIWSQEPVLTTEQLADFYGTEARRIGENFSRNMNHFVEGKHFFKLSNDLLREFKRNYAKSDLADNVNTLYLWTKRAAVIMATLGVKLENVSQVLLQQTMSFHDVIEKLAALGYTQLQGQNLSASNLLSLLKEQSLPLEEQPHKKGFFHQE